jgi:hypothetical protein
MHTRSQRELRKLGVTIENFIFEKRAVSGSFLQKSTPTEVLK